MKKYLDELNRVVERRMRRRQQEPPIECPNCGGGPCSVAIYNDHVTDDLECECCGYRFRNPDCELPIIQTRGATGWFRKRFGPSTSTTATATSS